MYKSLSSHLGDEFYRKIDRDKSDGLTLKEVRDYLQDGGIISRLTRSQRSF